MDRLHLDHASRWPLRPEARRAWLDATELGLGDPSRGYRSARDAGDLLDRSSATVAHLLAVDDRDVVWTSGGTEAVHLAVLGSARAAELRGARRRHIVTCAVEHSSVLRACERLRDEHGYDLDVVRVDAAGLVDPDDVAAALRTDTLAVHLQHSNHEVGAIQPTHAVAAACQRVGALLHVDACQSVGQLGVTAAQLGADLVSGSAAKFGGPPGTGFLALAPQGRVAALQQGDERQAGRRAGTPDVPSIAATAVALHVAHDRLQEEHSAREIARRWLRTALPAAVEDLQVHGPLADAHPGIVAFSALYVDGASLVQELDAAGYEVHSGSSCASTSGRPSHVLEAMGVLTHGHLRVSVGPEVDLVRLERFVAAYAAIVRRLRRLVRR